MDSQAAMNALLLLVTPQLLTLFVAAQVVQIVSLYLASKFVAGSNSTPANALRCYAYQLGAGLLIALLMGIVCAIVVGVGGGGLVVLPLMLGVATMLWALVRVAMGVYEIRGGSAIGMLVVSMIIGVILNVPVRWLLPVTLDPAAVQKLAALSKKPDGQPILPTSAIPALAPPTNAAPSPTVAALKRVVQPNRPVPAEVTVSEAVRVPIKLDGHVAGDVELTPGTKLKVVADDGDYVKVMNLDTVVRVPKSKLSY